MGPSIDFGPEKHTFSIIVFGLRGTQELRNQPQCGKVRLTYDSHSATWFPALILAQRFSSLSLSLSAKARLQV